MKLGHQVAADDMGSRPVDQVPVVDSIMASQIKVKEGGVLNCLVSVRNY